MTPSQCLLPRLIQRSAGRTRGALAGGLAETIRTGNGTSAAALWGWIRWRAVQAEHRRRDIQ